MTSLIPPASANWWKGPVTRGELIWLAIALVWCVIMFTMMPLWQGYDKQQFAAEAHSTTTEQFRTQVEEMVSKYKVGEEAGVPVVEPPAGSDIYMLGRLWQWYPILKLKKDSEYRLHLSSMDWQHGWSLQDTDLKLQIVPGYDVVVKLKQDKVGNYNVVCNEYCGIGHHTMVGKIYVTE